MKPISILIPFAVILIGSDASAQSFQSIPPPTVNTADLQVIENGVRVSVGVQALIEEGNFSREPSIEAGSDLFKCIELQTPQIREFIGWNVTQLRDGNFDEISIVLSYDPEESSWNNKHLPFGLDIRPEPMSRPRPGYVRKNILEVKVPLRRALTMNGWRNECLPVSSGTMNAEFRKRLDSEAAAVIEVEKILTELRSLGKLANPSEIGEPVTLLKHAKDQTAQVVATPVQGAEPRVAGATHKRH